MNFISQFSLLKLSLRKKIQKTLNHIAARGAIILINQLSLLLALPLVASRVDLITFGKIAIGLIIIQISWLIGHWGVQNFSIENWHKLKKRSEKNQIISWSCFIAVRSAPLSGCKCNGFLGHCQCQDWDYERRFLNFLQNQRKERCRPTRK